MAITVKVAGINRTEEWQRTADTSWEDPLNGRGTGRIRFGDDVGAFAPSDGQSFEIIDGSVTAFAGILMEPDQHEPEKAGFVMYDCQLADYNILADRRTVGENFDNIALELVVSGIITDHMSGEGISLAGVETGPALTSLNPNIKATESFNDLSDQTGRAWYIDLDAVTGLTMNMHARTSISAPAIVDGDMALLGTVRVREDRQKYRNEQIIRAGSDEFPILAVSGNLIEQAARAVIEDTAGIYSDVQTFPEILNQDNALEKAGDLLDRFAKITKVVTLQTRTAGFRAGQSATVNFPNHDVNNEVMLIDNVTAQVVTLRTDAGDTQEIWYTLSCITGDPFGGWLEHFRKVPPVKGLLRFANDDLGLFRVEPQPGAVVHDPIPGPFGWFQSPTSTPTVFPQAYGLLHSGASYATVRRGDGADTGGCSGGEFPGCTGSCHGARQNIIEVFAIDPVTRLPGIAPTACASTTVFNVGTNYKRHLPIKPDDTLMAYIQTNTTGTRFGLIDLSTMTIKGDVASTVLNNSNLSEMVWIGDHCYVCDGTGTDLFIYDCTDPDSPIERTPFTTSCTLIRSLVPSPDGTVLYCNGGNGIVALDMTDRNAPVEDTALSSGGPWASLDINDDGDQLLMLKRNSSSVVGYTAVSMTLNGTDIAFVEEFGTISLSTTSMDGSGAIWRGSRIAVYSRSLVGSPSNSLRLHVFDTEDLGALTLVETLSYNHGLSSNVGPFRQAGVPHSFYRLGLVDNQVTYGVESFDVPVPLTIDPAMRVGFGGTGLPRYTKGDLLYADRILPDTSRGAGELSRRSIGSTGQHMVVSGGLPVWQDPVSLSQPLTVAAAADVMSRLSLRF